MSYTITACLQSTLIQPSMLSAYQMAHIKILHVVRGHAWSCSKLGLVASPSQTPFCRSVLIRPRSRSWAAASRPQLDANARSTSREATASSSNRDRAPFDRCTRHARELAPSCTATYT